MEKAKQANRKKNFQLDRKRPSKQTEGKIFNLIEKAKQARRNVNLQSDWKTIYI